MQGPLKFYVRLDSKAVEDILSMYRDKKNNPEFKDATIVFIGSEIVNSYSKIVNDMSDDTKIDDHIKKYQQGKDYLEVKLSRLENKRKINKVPDSVKQLTKEFENADQSTKSDGSTKCETESKACAENLSILDRILCVLCSVFSHQI